MDFYCRHSARFRSAGGEATRAALIACLLLFLAAFLAPFAANAQELSLPAPAPTRQANAVAWTMPFSLRFSQEEAAALLRAKTAASLLSAAAQALARRTGLPVSSDLEADEPDWTGAAIAQALGTYSFTRRVQTAGNESGTCTVIGTWRLPEKGAGARVALLLKKPDELEAVALALATRAGVAAAMEKGVAAAVAPAFEPALSKRELRRLARRLEDMERLLPALLAQFGWKKAPEDPLTDAALEKMTADGNPLAAYLLGGRLMKEGRLAAAVEAYEACLNVAPAFAAGHYASGLAFLQLSLPDLARREFSAAIGVRGAPHFYVARGTAAMKLGDEAAMCADYAQACALGRCEEYRWAQAGGKCARP